MLLVRDFSQSRLAVFVVDAASGRPLRRVPVYAEIVLSSGSPGEGVPVSPTRARPSNSHSKGGSPTEVPPSGARSDRLSDSQPGHELRMHIPDETPFDSETLQGLQTDQPRLANLIRAAAKQRISEAWVKENPKNYLVMTNVLLDNILSINQAFKHDPDEPIPAAVEAQIQPLMNLVASEAKAPPPEPDARLRTQVIPLGLLATDHVGFVSYDLERLRIRQLVPKAAHADTQISFLVYPGLLEADRVDVLSQNRFSSDAVVARIELTDA
jgi:hypothetical protein